MAEKEDREDRVIAQFCERLSLVEGVSVKVVARPDRENRGRGGADAVIDRGGQHYALEHATMDTFPGQRRDSARFRRAIVPLEDEIRRAFPDSAVEISVPIGAVPTGRRWEDFTAALIDGCKSVIQGLGFGQRAEVALAGIARVRISRHRKSHEPICLVMRFAPDDVVAEMARVLPDLISGANRQLVPYKQDGCKTILLLDTDDHVLISRPQVPEAFVRAVPEANAESVDEVYVAETYRDPIWIYPVLVSGQVYSDLPEYQRFLNEQYRLTYGEAPYSDLLVPHPSGR